MTVGAVMTPKPSVVRPETSVQQAAQMMRDWDIGPLPVCDTNNRLVGMVTDRDMTVRATAEGRDPVITPVSDVMTRDVAYVFEDQSTEEAARVMQDKQIRRVAVLNRNHDLVGILSLGDIALSDMEDFVTAQT